MTISFLFFYTEITNVEFHAGKAEDTLHKVCRELPENCEVVAIVDPPRCGLHTKVSGIVKNSLALCPY